ncbi:hypothetical protein BC749_10495 [Flavobacterium araucananum]|uniref:Uncharacterized protein n=1 Tax=Flavobacterium araucananum TaxID=946678 RepID=A0A227NVW1_9FLAO|nr:hypothetical protein [Flavobacterium araucananum]OXG01562.1 hypothetical protein B0A64_19045 [Flavobacterium araucananum]PWJ98949.1 hypothetical protein BC749_10495 [Flavobacterium araucananum]
MILIYSKDVDDFVNNVMDCLDEDFVRIGESDKVTIEAIKIDFEHQYDEIIDEYFVFLISNRLIFFNSNPALFPKMSTEWNSPSLITNIIIDYDEIIHDFSALIPQFESLKCSYIQLRFYKNIRIDYIKSIVELLRKEKSRIVSIDFILPYSENLNLEELNHKIKTFKTKHYTIILHIAICNIKLLQYSLLLIHLHPQPCLF